MADHSFYRSKSSNEPYGGRSAERSVGGDPLSELARLIGGDSGTERPRAGTAPREDFASTRHAPAMAGDADWRSEAAAMRPLESDEEPRDDYRDHGYSEADNYPAADEAHQSFDHAGPS